VLATGTPISNTMAEAWTMLRFIGADRLSELSLSTFDQFAGTFGQVIPSFELTTSGQFKCVDRFAKFVNIGQLSELYRSYVDVVLNDDIVEFKRDNTLPVLLNEGYTSHSIPQTDGVAEELYRIREELKRFERMTGDQKKENCHIPLVMYGQAKKATLDIRLLRADSPDEADSKVNVAIQEISRVYQQTADYKGTQLVFSDTFQSPAQTDKYLDEDGYIANPNYGKARFNMFEDIRAKLIVYGLDPSEVAIVPVDAKKREPVFEKVRTGEVRVLLGTSERMGVGVNIQDRLAAVHHLDAPNRPTDFQQRNGRLIRQGNLHAQWGIPVEIITYGVTQTLDATAYGRLAIKQKFINQVLQGTLDSDVISDLGGDDDFAAMSFDQMMATLSGSQYALLFTAKDHELTRVLQQKKNWQRGMIDAQTYVERASRQTELYAGRMAQYGLEAEVIKMRFPEQSITQVEVEGEVYTEGWMAHVERYTLDLKARARRGAGATGTIKLNGLTIGLRGIMVDTNVDGRAIYGIEYSWGLTLKTSVLNAPGLFVSLRAGLNRVLDAPAEAAQWLAHNEKIVKEFSLKLNQSFKGESLIESLTVEVAELKALMERDSKEEGQVSETALEMAMA